MSKPRLLLADDHILVLDGLRKLLEPEFEILETVGDGRALVAAAERLRPDLILLDISMPLLNGIEAARQIRQALPSAKMLFVTMQADKRYVQEAFRTGAFGYMLKQSAAAELLVAIRKVLHGQYYVTPALAEGLDVGALDPRRNPSELFGGTLTPRQREVLQLVAEGKTAKEIADILCISVRTVEFHKAGMMEELGLRTTAELTRYAVEHGIVENTA